MISKFVVAADSVNSPPDVPVHSDHCASYVELGYVRGQKSASNKVVTYMLLDNSQGQSMLCCATPSDGLC